MTILKIVIITVDICFCVQSALAESAASVIGKSLRYCNPLSIETSSQDGSPRGVSLGDVTVVRENNRYYMFCTGGGFGFGGRSGTAQPANTTIAHQYKIEASTDGTTYTTVLDKTDNNITKYIEFEEIPPTTCRFVRLTITDRPSVGNSNLGIMEFTIFGEPIEP